MESNPMKNQHTLSIRIFSDGFSLYIIDNKGEIIAAKHLKSEELNELSIQDEFKNTAELTQKYTKVKIRFETGYYTLVPSVFDDDSEFHNLLRLHQPDLDVDSIVCSTILANSQNRYIYAVDALWDQAIKSVFPDATPELHLMPLLQNHTDAAIIWIRKDAMDIAVKIGGEVLLVNDYKYQTPEDLLYFSLNVFKELKISKDQIPVTIYHTSDMQPELLFKGFFAHVNAIPQWKWYENN